MFDILQILSIILISSTNNQENEMTKSEQKHVIKALAGAKYFSDAISPDYADDYLARALSIISRSTLKTKTKSEITNIARDHGVMFNPEFTA